MDTVLKKERHPYFWVGIVPTTFFPKPAIAKSSHAISVNISLYIIYITRLRVFQNDIGGSLFVACS